jgi:hypothetical protein
MERLLIDLALLISMLPAIAFTAVVSFGLVEWWDIHKEASCDKKNR